MPNIAFNRAMDAPWAMLQADIENVLTVASGFGDKSPEALAAYREKKTLGERAKVRGNVALIYAQGPMFKGANLFTEVSGATSYEIMARDLQAALESPAIDAIMLCLDTPGGEAHGCDELAHAIFAARSIKPIESYVSGFAASAGYWLASATDKITVSDLSSVGSIGVVMGVADKQKAKESGIIEFVSSQSPHKRPDVQTDEGRAKIQQFVDAMGDVFVSAVAKHRNVSVETVLEKFGGGGMEVGANAVKAGMADYTGQFEAALSQLSMRGKNSRFLKGKKMSTEANTDLETTARNARTEERTRISKITGHAAFKTHGTLATLLMDSEIGADQAVSILTAASADATAVSDAAVKAAAEKENEPSAEEKFKKDQEAAGALGLRPENLGGGQNPTQTADAWKSTVARLQ